MHRIAVQLLGSLNAPGALPTFLQETATLFQSANASITVVSEENPSEVSLWYGVGLDAERIGFCTSLTAGALGEAFRLDCVRVIEDYRTWPDRLDDPRLAAITTVMTTPLRSDRKLIGFLQLSWTDAVHPLSTADIDTFRQFSLLASVAVASAIQFERVRREKTLTDLFFDTFPGMVCVFEETGRICRFNRNFLSITGYTAEELYAARIFDLLATESAGLVPEKLQLLLSDGFVSFEADIQKKDGSILTAALCGATLRHEGQTRIVGIGMDITQRRQLEAELRQHRDRLELLVKERTAQLSAVNDEMTAMNDELQETNQQLLAEIGLRQRKEAEILLHEQQYRAAAQLLTHSAEKTDATLAAILGHALQLVQAPAGYIGFYNPTDNTVIVSQYAGPIDYTALNPHPADQGFLRQVVASGEIQYVEDYRRFPDRIQNPRLDRLTSLISIPLKHGHRLIGILAAHWLDAPFPLKQEHIEILRQYGVLAAAVLERNEVHLSLAQRNELLLGLADTYSALLNELDLNSVLQIVLNKALTLTGIDHGFIHLFNAAGEQGSILAGQGRYAGQVGAAVNFCGGLLAEVRRTGQLQIVPDYANWPLRPATPQQEGVTMAMQAPLKIGDKLIGVIGLSAFGEEVSLNQDKLYAIEHLASVAAIAVKNAIQRDETRRLAYYDTLTGMANRASLTRWLDAEMARARSGESHGVLFFIDLDDLKTVNDTFGHSFGDDVIIAAGAFIWKSVSPQAFVARIGGDEFVVVWPGQSDRTAIGILAKHLVNSLSQEYQIARQRVHLTASVGIALYPADGATSEDILKNADSAMYAAKRSGRNCWAFYEPALQEDAFEKIRLTNSLRQALEAEELLLYFQPIVTAADQSILGFEALLRWNSADLGWVAPDRFIPYAEQSGLILPIGRWVLEEACRFARQLARLGRRDLRVSVNISPRQLADENFILTVRNALHASGTQPAQLEIEVTETLLIEAMEDSVQKLRELRELGLSVALDDFGTGYSSLTYLRCLPVDTLKVDKSFIAGIVSDDTQADLVGAIIGMAHILKLAVVAEGVETDAQLQTLRHQQCDCIQGYVFSVPVPAERALDLLEF